MSVSIKTVSSKKDLKAFVKFPLELYKGCPYYVPGLFMDEMASSVISAFYAQDIDAIKAAMDVKLHNSCDSSPEEEDGLIYNRNADWITKMPALMAQKPTLFAVGAAHLPGEKGVLNLLRKAGYTVEGVVK